MFFWRHGKRLQINHFDYGVEYKPNGRTCKFQYQWLEIFGRLEEIYIEASVAFLKCFSSMLKFYRRRYFKYLYKQLNQQNA